MHYNDSVKYLRVTLKCRLDALGTYVNVILIVGCLRIALPNSGRVRRVACNIVATFDLSAANLDLFETDHWLKSEQNVIHLRLQTKVRFANPCFGSGVSGMYCPKGPGVVEAGPADRQWVLAHFAEAPWSSAEIALKQPPSVPRNATGTLEAAADVGQYDEMKKRCSLLMATDLS